MIQLVGRLVIASSLLVAVACGDSKDENDTAKAVGKAQGFTGAGAPGTPATATGDKTKPSEAATKPGGSGTLGATPPTVSGDNPAAAADEIAKQAAQLANQAGKNAGGTLGTVPGMPAPAPVAAKKPVTTAQGVARLHALEANACSCTSRPCANKALTAFGALYNDIKDMAADKATYADVKKRSASITRCLMKHGITGQQVMAIFQGGAKAPGAGAGAPGSAASLAARLETMATQACTCTDKACATRALGQLAAYYAANKDVQADQAQLTRIKNASAKMATCMMKNGIEARTLQAIFQ